MSASCSQNDCGMQFGDFEEDSQYDFHLTDAELDRMLFYENV